MMRDSAQLQTIAEEVIARAVAGGADQAELGLQRNTGFTAVVRLREPEQVMYHNDQGLELTVLIDQRQASVSTTDFSSEALDKLVKKALSIVRFTDSDPCGGLAPAALMATTFSDMDLYHPWSLSTAEALALATRCEEAGLAFDKRIVNSEGAWVETSSGIQVCANSYGFLHAMPSSHHAVGVSYIAKEKDDMERDHEYTSAVAAEDLESVTEVALRAAERTVSRLGSRSLSTRKCPVIFSVSEAKGLFGAFLSAISGGNLYRKSSFLLDSLGEKIFPSFITLTEDPFILRAVGSAAYDDDGVFTRKQSFVENGVVTRYVLSHYSAQQLKMETTGNAGGVHNLIVNTSTDTLAGLMQRMGTGLLVTELMGQGVNLVTGDYSRGAAGFWVENGVIAYPVHEITIAGHLRDIFANLVSVANDIDIRGNIRSGSVLVEEMMVAGQS